LINIGSTGNLYAYVQKEQFLFRCEKQMKKQKLARSS